MFNYFDNRHRIMSSILKNFSGQLSVNILELWDIVIFIFAGDCEGDAFPPTRISEERLERDGWNAGGRIAGRYYDILAGFEQSKDLWDPPCVPITSSAQASTVVSLYRVNSHSVDLAFFFIIHSSYCILLFIALNQIACTVFMFRLELKKK